MSADTTNIINLFWFEVGTPIDEEITLCPLRILSMKSYLTHGYQVNFWSYQPITNPIDHPNFYTRDAREIISQKQFESYNITLKKPQRYEKRKTLHIANFTDLFRILVIYKVGGWWSDTDSYCIGKLPKPDKLDKGVIFSSLPTKVDGSRGIRNHLCVETTKFRKGGVWKGWNGRSQFSNSYMYAEKGHPLMPKIAKRVKSTFFKDLKYGFIEPMLVVYDVVFEEGYMASIRPPSEFIPLPWWRNRFMYTENDGIVKRTSYGAYIPTYDEVMKKSSCVNFYNGMFKYLHEKKPNVVKRLFKYICDENRIYIDPETLQIDEHDGNFHAPKEDRKRKRNEDHGLNKLIKVSR